MEIVVAFLAGLCPDWWPFPRWWRKKWWWPWPPPPPPLRDEGSPHPEPWRPGPEPWDFVGGLISGAGGAVAWVVIGPDLGREGSLLAPVVLGFLGGVAASWLVDAVGSLAQKRR
ncbi:MAG TPA: hypothetical protein VF603_07805 [Allosphingosinicella sp.]|jgi:hypothetical protein